MSDETKNGTTDTKDSKTESFNKEFSRIVYVRRKPQIGALPGQDLDEAKSKIGSSFKDGSVLRGLKFDEEIRFLETLLGVNKTSQNWEKMSKEYWANITKLVPPGDGVKGDGLKLEIGLRYTNKEDYEADLKAPLENGAIINPKGTPIKLDDYIIWRYCLVYGDVANSFEDVGKSPKIRFYLFNKEKEVQDKKTMLNIKSTATKLMYQRIAERDWVDYVLRVLVAADKESKVTLRELAIITADEKDIILDEYLQKNPARFLEIGSDKNLETKAFIEIAIAVGKLARIPNTTTVTHDGETLGNTTDEVVTYLQNPVNAKFFQAIKAQVNLVP